MNELLRQISGYANIESHETLRYHYAIKIAGEEASDYLDIEGHWPDPITALCSIFPEFEEEDENHIIVSVPTDMRGLGEPDSHVAFATRVMMGKLQMLHVSFPAQIPVTVMDSFELDFEFYENGEERDFPADRLGEIGLEGSTVTIIGNAGVSVTHEAPNGKSFTVGDILSAIADTERKTRHKTPVRWFDDFSPAEMVDIHHVFYEGCSLQEDGSILTYWGS